MSSYAKTATHAVVMGDLLDSAGLDRPVENVIILEAFSNKQVSEELSKIRVIGLVIESKGSTVVEIDGELVGEASAENLGGSSHLLLHDSVVLLLLGSSLESLPWKLTSQEVLFVSSRHAHRLTINT